MKYKVVYPFIEKGVKYWSGDIYTNEDKKRIKELSTENNKLKKVLIKPIDADGSKKASVETTKKVDGAPEEEKAK